MSRTSSLLSSQGVVNAAILVLLVASSIWGQDCCGGNLHELLQFAADNGRRYVSIVTNSSAKEVSTLDSSLRSFSLYLRLISYDRFDELHQYNQDFNIFFLDDVGSTNLSSLITTISSTRIRDSLIFIRQSGDWEAVFEQIMTSLELNLNFYLVYPLLDDVGHATPELRWLSVLKLEQEEQVVFTAVAFVNGTRTVRIEGYDLQGLAVTSESKDWYPYLIFTNCDEDGLTNCDSVGFIVESAKVIADSYNFTIVSKKNPYDDWGLTPKSGPANLSGEWSGILGNVVTGKFAFSLSQWYVLFERNEILDFALTTSDGEIMALTPQPPEVDTGLFIRPFTEDSWTAILTVTGIIVVVFIAPYFTINYFEKTSGYMIANISAWYFFVLLNAFYGGALTMFFSSEVTIPFTGVQDVIRAYPDWKLLMLDGTQVLYESRAAQGDSAYIEFWERVRNNPEDTVYPSVGEGLTRISHERAVVMMMSGIMKGWFQENPFHHQELLIFGRQRQQWNSLILTKNSPMTPVFSHGFNRLRENGALDQLLINWEGKALTSNLKVDKMTLSPGQVILVYLLMGMAIFLATLILTGELVIKKMQNFLCGVGTSEKPAIKSKSLLTLHPRGMYDFAS